MSFVANFSAANLSLESLTRNYSAKSWRYETHEGRKYIVSPMTMIVPGVLNGSKGRLFYPEDEVGKDPTPWNGMPITHYHPSVDGKPVSANHERAQEQHIGFVKKATSLGKLKAEAWVDIEKADARDIRIVQSIRNGNPMEISTGLYTDNFPAPKGSMWKGKPYDHVARNYRPDHLAILPDQKGACSINDGCGLGINQEVVDNDWAEWNRTHGKGKGFPIKGRKATPSKSNPTQAKMEHHLSKQKEHAQAAIAAKKAGNHSLAKQHAKQSESHANEIHSLRGKTPGGSDPKALARAQKSHAAFLKRDPARAKGNADKAQKELAKAKQAHAHTKRAVALATKHSQEKADQHKNAAALVRAHLDAAKLHTKHGDSKNAGKALDKARKAVIDYSKNRASQHEKVAAAFAKAGDHKMAAHYKARADFHHAHIAKISKKTPAHNSEFMPRGEREFVMNQLSENNRWPQKRRDELDKSDFAGPDESFPIKTQKDVHSAAKLIGHAADPEAVKKRIIAIAKRKGLSLPESWATENMFSPAARLAAKMKRQQEKRNEQNIRKQRNLAAGAKQTEGKSRTKMPITDRKNAEAKATSKTSEGVARTKAKDAEITKRVEAKKLEMAQVTKKPTTVNVQFFITENAMSHEELRGKLDHALRSKLTQNDPTPYLHEVHDDHVKYEHGGEMKKCAYKVTDNDEVKVGKPKTLKRVTTYEEAEADEPEMNSNPQGHNQYTQRPSNKLPFHVHSQTDSHPHGIVSSHKTLQSAKSAAKEHHQKTGRKATVRDPKGNPIAVAGKGLRRPVSPRPHDSRFSENQLTEDGIEPSTTTPRKGGNMAKLTANQRTATIDKLTSNEGCGCFNEEDKDYLSGLSDERLQALQAKHAEHTENADPEDDDDEEPEDVQTDNKEKPVKKERMTINEFREIAPVEYLEAVDHAARITNAEKAKIVTKLTSHLKDGDVKKRLTANLSKQSLEDLEDQLLLIPEPVKAAAPATRTVYGPTGNSIVTDDPVENEEDDVAQMLSPRIDYVALSKEHAEMSRRN